MSKVLTPDEAMAKAREHGWELMLALEGCVKKLRRCADLQGNADWAIDAMCEPYDRVLAKARGDANA